MPDAFTERLKKATSQCEMLERKHQQAVAAVRSERENLKCSRDKLTHSLQSQELLQSVVQTVQQNVHKRIADVVTRCLETVFDEPYAFKIHFERKRGKTEARLVFERDGHEVDPKSAAGGGVLDVAAFALRLACLMLSRPRRRKLLVLDESFKMVSSEYLPRVRELLLSLAKDLGVQIVLVTHQRGLDIGKVIEL